MSPPAAAATSPLPRGGGAHSHRRSRASVAAPRRLSGPARSGARAPRAVQAQPGLLIGVGALVERLARRRALDRLIRGRIWIALIAFALIGIVLLQLLILQLNASIGRSLVREGQLQHTNAALSIEGSELTSGERVESLAAHVGMQLVPISALRFLSSDPRADIARAAAALSARAHGAATASQEASSESASASAAGASTSAAEGAGASGSAGVASPAEAATGGQSQEAQAGSPASGEASPASAPEGQASPAGASAAPGGAVEGEAPAPQVGGGGGADASQASGQG